ncbi:hypothetical protein BGX33_002840 [Mortierella sp. NVP41]|nr:hypothetical protein BGX33_002840 [Mortierella sp. NVP41]
MPPKRRSSGSAIDNTTQETTTSSNDNTALETTTSTSDNNSITPKKNTRGRRASGDPITTNDADLGQQQQPPVKKLRGPRGPYKKRVKVQPESVSDAVSAQAQAQGQQQPSQHDVNHAALEDEVVPEQEQQPSTDQAVVKEPSSQPTTCTPTTDTTATTTPQENTGAQSAIITSTPATPKPLITPRTRRQYKPRQPKIATSGPNSQQTPHYSLLSETKPAHELKHKDSKPWHACFKQRIPSFNKSSTTWELSPPPPRDDVLTPEDLEKMIVNDYSRRRRNPPSKARGGRSARAGSYVSTEGEGEGEDGTAEETATQEQTPRSGNKEAAGKTRKSRGDTPGEQHSDSDSQTDDDDFDDNDSDSGDDDQRNKSCKSQSRTPGPHTDDEVDVECGGKKAKKPRITGPRIKFRFPVPVPSLEYPYLQSAFPYNDHHQPPKHQAEHSDYGVHAQPLPDLWHRPQGSVSVEDLFSLHKLDYSIKMIKKQPVESNKLRMDLYFRRGFQLASKKVLDRARVTYYGKSDYIYKHTLQVPTLYNELDEAYLGELGRPQENVNVVRQLLKGKEVMHATPSLLNTNPSLAPTTTTTTTAAAAASTTTTSTTATTFSSHQNPQQDASQTQSNNAVIDDERTEAEAAAVKEQMAYYEVNQFLAAMFTHKNLGSSKQQVDLSPRACTILRTLLAGLERKVIAMGCHLQRAELTKRLADIDIYLASRNQEVVETKKSKKGGAAQDDGTSSQAREMTSPSPMRSPTPTPAQAQTPTKDPKSPGTVSAYETPLYPMWEVDPDDYYVRHAMYRRSGTQLSSTSTLTSTADTPQEQDGDTNNNDENPFLVMSRSQSVVEDGQPETSASTSISTSTSTSTSTPAATGAATIMTKTTATESRLPFVNNPLRIPDEMEPFWRVRNYLERASLGSSTSMSASASSSGPATAPRTVAAVDNMNSEIERLRQAQRDLALGSSNNS